MTATLPTEEITVKDVDRLRADAARWFDDASDLARAGDHTAAQECAGRALVALALFAGAKKARTTQ